MIQTNHDRRKIDRRQPSFNEIRILVIDLRSKNWNISSLLKDGIGSNIINQKIMRVQNVLRMILLPYEMRVL